MISDKKQELPCFRILLVTYFYSPDKTPRAFRWQALTEYFKSRGHTVDVLTTGTKSVYSEQANNRVFRFSRKLSGGNGFNTGSSKISKKTGIISLNNPFISKLYAMTVKHFFWPDRTILWLFPALKQLFKLRREKYTCIISSGLPFSSHVVGYFAYRLLSCPWLMEYGDPFTGNLGNNSKRNFRLLGFLDRIVEGRFLRNAYAISVPIENGRKHLIDLFPKSIGKVHIFPQFYVDPDLSQMKIYQNQIHLEPNAYHLIYAGTLYKEIRNPELLFEGLYELEKKLSVRPIMHLIGNCREVMDIIDAHRLRGIDIRTYGIQDREYCLTFYQKAHVVINLLNISATQEPSKNAECGLFARRLLILDPKRAHDEYNEKGVATVAYHSKNFPQRLTSILLQMSNDRINNANNDDIVKCSDIGDKFLDLITANLFKKSFSILQ